MGVSIGNSWDALLSDAFAQPYYQKLRAFLKDEYAHRTIYPPMHDIWNALRFTPYEDVRVVILGQDPYHGPNQAHGLCFSVKHPTPPPPSLVNIFKELNDELGMPIPDHGDLTAWAQRGVLLLNTCLTVRAGQANSHRGMGWEPLTDRIIELLNQREQPMCFLLWGNNAKAKAALIDGTRHRVLQCAHPSPLSAYNGFFGCGHFTAANAFLEQCGYQAIDWRLGE